MLHTVIEIDGFVMLWLKRSDEILNVSSFGSTSMHRGHKKPTIKPSRIAVKIATGRKHRSIQSLLLWKQHRQGLFSPSDCAFSALSATSTCIAVSVYNNLYLFLRCHTRPHHPLDFVKRPRVHLGTTRASYKLQWLRVHGASLGCYLPTERELTLLLLLLLMMMICFIIINSQRE